MRATVAWSNVSLSFDKWIIYIFAGVPDNPLDSLSFSFGHERPRPDEGGHCLGKVIYGIVELETDFFVRLCMSFSRVLEE